MTCSTYGNRFIAFTHNFLNGVQLADPLTGLRVVRAEILRNWKVKSKGFDIEVELNHRVEREGFGIVEIPIQYRERLGEKKLKVRHGAEIFKRILLETGELNADSEQLKQFFQRAWAYCQEFFWKELMVPVNVK